MNWSSVVEPLELLKSRLEYAWSAVTHLNGVKNNDDLRNAYQKVQNVNYFKLVEEQTKGERLLPLGS